MPVYYDAILLLGLYIVYKVVNPMYFHESVYVNICPGTQLMFLQYFEYMFIPEAPMLVLWALMALQKIVIAAVPQDFVEEFITILLAVSIF